MAERFADAESVMRRALALATGGRGLVEPNPMVGAVVVDADLRLVAEGRHERFGGPHAEVVAIANAGDAARGGALFVTLEPCCHFGKTSPCSKAVIAAGIRKVVAAMGDPAPHVSGGGFAELRAAGIEVEVGLLEADARRLNAPFLRRISAGLPWVHAKWAMTLDGHIASRTGASRWVSNEASRRAVHALRGRMDAIVVGSGTARADDPLLTARPPGPRIPTRVVVDSRAGLSLASQLVTTARDVPTLVACTSHAPDENVRNLLAAGVEVLTVPSTPAVGGGRDSVDLRALLSELCRRGMTHVLVEGGASLLGSLFDAGLVDEVHAVVAPKIVGGAAAPAAVAGEGLPHIPDLPSLDGVEIENLQGDVLIHGRVRRAGA